MTTNFVNPSRLTPVSSFDPSTIATHHSLFWAENPAQSLVNGTQYALWKDMSGNGRDATDLGFGSQYQPYFRSSVSGLGNQPAFEFDGVDDFFCQPTTYTALTQPYGLVVIGAATDRNSGEVQGFAGGSASAGNHRSDLFMYSDNVVYMNAGTSVGGGSASTTKHIWIIEFNGASSKLWQDGTQIATGNPSTQGPTSLIIGSLFNINFPLDGHIALVGLKSSAFTSTERSDYLAGSQAHYGTP